MRHRRRWLWSGLWLVALASCKGTALRGGTTKSLPQALSHDGAQDQAHDRYWHAGDKRAFPERLSYPTDVGVITTLNLAGPTQTADHPFFVPLGTNGRACITCHQPADAMSLSARTAREVWEQRGSTDPLFAAIDGANCPSLPQHERASHSLLLERGLFRVARPWPPHDAAGQPIEPEFDIEVVSDPSGCNTDNTYGLQSPTPMVSVFRRPRQAANLKFATAYGFPFDPKDGLPLERDPETGELTSGNLLADARERTLRGQTLDALISHAQTVGEPDRAQLERIVAFESQLYTAQSQHAVGGALDSDGAQGGPEALARAPAGKLQSTKKNPIWGPEFLAWAAPLAARAEPAAPLDPQRAFRESVARGVMIFAGRQFLVSDSAGITDMGFGNPVRNSCAFCHNMRHAGMDVAPGQVDLGTTNLPTANPLPDLPRFRLTCHSDARPHPHLGRVVYTHDPGYALTTGKCRDIGKITAQSLRGIAARPPYFVNGSAKTLAEVIEFYDKRYEMQLSDQEKLDLLHLLEVL